MKDKLKVVFDYRIFMYQKHGGISRYFVSLFTSLKKKVNPDTFVCSPLFTNSYLRAVSRENVTGFYMANYKWDNQIKNTFVKLINRTGEFFLLFFNPPDIYHITYYDRIPPHLKKTKMVVSVYDMIHELFPDEYAGNPSVVKKQCIEGADLVICISENTKRDLIRLFGIREEKIRVIHLGFSDFISDDSKKIDKPDYLANPFILFVGQRSGYKNFANLAKAFSFSSEIIKDFNLVCFGGGRFSDSEIFLLKELNIQDKTFQLDGDDDILQVCYTSASLFVYPSLYEGFGIPPLEAMSCETVVCCSNTSSLPEVVGDAAVLFDSDDVESITEAMCKVLYSPKLKDELISKGKKRVKNFTWEKCVTETLEAYKTII